MNICRCLWCGISIRWREYLCATCFASLAWNGQACGYCALPLASYRCINDKCAHCVMHFRDMPIRTACLYNYPLTRMIPAWKFASQLGFTAWFAELLHHGSLTRPGFFQADALVPVPMHPHRLRKRGYNHAQLLACAWSRLSGVPVLDTVCVRRLETSTQVGLSKAERYANVAGVFSVLKPVVGLSIIIVDDVVTTGSTMRAVGLALQNAGARSTVGWAISRQV